MHRREAARDQHEDGRVVEPLEHLAAGSVRREQVVHPAQAEQQHARESEHAQRDHAGAVAASALQENNPQDREDHRGGQVGQGAERIAESGNGQYAARLCMAAMLTAGA